MLTTYADPTPGPSRVIASRIKTPDADRLDAILTTTGETYAELVRRLVLVHLDAMAA